MFGVGESTVCAVGREVCEAIKEECWEEYVAKFFPNDETRMEDLLTSMGAEWQFQYAFSAIDGSHLPIKCPNGGAEAMKQY